MLDAGCHQKSKSFRPWKLYLAEELEFFPADNAN